MLLPATAALAAALAALPHLAGVTLREDTATARDLVARCPPAIRLDAGLPASAAGELAALAAGCAATHVSAELPPLTAALLFGDALAASAAADTYWSAVAASRVAALRGAGGVDALVGPANFGAVNPSWRTDAIVRADAVRFWSRLAALAAQDGFALHLPPELASPAPATGLDPFCLLLQGVLASAPVGWSHAAAGDPSTPPAADGAAGPLGHRAIAAACAAPDVPVLVALAPAGGWAARRTALRGWLDLLDAALATEGPPARVTLEALDAGAADDLAPVLDVYLAWLAGAPDPSGGGGGSGGVTPIPGPGGGGSSPANPDVDGSGCSTGGGAGLLALLAVPLLGLRRRRQAPGVKR